MLRPSDNLSTGQHAEQTLTDVVCNAAKRFADEASDIMKNVGFGGKTAMHSVPEMLGKLTETAGNDKQSKPRSVHIMGSTALNNLFTEDF